jgi:selenide,water dikinase
MKFPTDENLIVGLDHADDAGVYKVTDDLAIIQTVDFFTPIVDDPYWFGQIAAANALSDIYAMGGVPKTAMNLVAFPAKDMDISVLREIIRGGLDKMNEADVVLVGGHSVQDKELKYGLSVTGFIHPDHILTKKNLKAGDRLILTKPLGTGVINTAIKGGLASPEIIDIVTQLMSRLNREAAETMKRYPVHACTDITGFGLLGHLSEMVQDSGFSAQIKADNIPILPETLNYAAMGLIPGGTFNNRDFYECIVEVAPSVDRLMQDVLYDPQTSGGLLISVEKDHADGLLRELKEKGIHDATVIGEVVPEPKGKISVS